ncbi:SdrD B-like domain-containing protein [Candidatus Protofrankia californiensis]|uniref:SdrD B-like domain-containing protein n=1 Tax=Candidatus Protofrankia californiensis TaxID=1839754 RepID=UPI001041B7C5|nr:SdrD B-like domain-containing protein [Candidatus Protofrankia californiensis]
MIGQPATAQTATAQTATAQPEITGAAVTRHLSIVQLGDSYSAGNGAGAGTYDTGDGPRGCHRSAVNWGERYAQWLRDERGYDVTYVNRACSGAATDDLLNPHKADQRSYWTPLRAGETGNDPAVLGRLRQDCSAGFGPEESAEIGPVNVTYGIASAVCTRVIASQINAVGADTDLVLLTIGGNDVRFADIVLRCFAFGIPKALGIPAGDIAECERLTRRATGDLTLVQTRLVTLLTRLHQRMPAGGRVVLLTYPYLSSRKHYPPPGIHLPPGTQTTFGDTTFDPSAAVRTLGDRGDAIQITAADTVNQSFGFTGASDPAAHTCSPDTLPVDSADTPGRFVTVVDTVKCHFAGHEPDPAIGQRNPDRWMNEFLDGFLTLDQSLIYHPNSEGHRQLANLLKPFGDFGASARSSISGNAYLDADRNGRQDLGEPGAPGVAIQLTGTNPDGTAIRRDTTTNASGAWTFRDLVPGVYAVQEDTPRGGSTASTALGPGTFTDIVLDRVGSTATGYTFAVQNVRSVQAVQTGRARRTGQAELVEHTEQSEQTPQSLRAARTEDVGGTLLPLAVAGAMLSVGVPATIMMIRHRTLSAPRSEDEPVSQG